MFGGAVLILAAANAGYVAIASGYDWQIGRVHLVAHGVFKPLLLLNLVFVALTLIRRPSASYCEETRGDRVASALRPALLVVALILCVYGLSLCVNFDHNDWTHRFNSAAHRSVGSLGRYFYEPQLDGFYRPLGFLSLWIDQHLFGEALRWYHLQNLVLHCLNAVLVMSLAAALGYGAPTGTVAALVFAAVPASFEPVLWPGARFDLLSAFFSLAALLLFIRYVSSGRPRTAPLWAGAAFLCGLLSKEAAYCVPLLLVAIRMSRESKLGSSGERSRWRIVLAETLGIAAAMIALRLCLFGGLGGYPMVNREPVQFKVTPRTLMSLLTRAPGVVPFALNGAGPTPLGARITVAAYALLLLGLAAEHRPSPGDPRRWLSLCFLISALPVLNLVGWIGPSLMQGRYLYAPAVWWSLLMASVLVRSRRSRLLIAGWVIVTGTAAFFNTYAQAAGLERIRESVHQIRSDWQRSPQCRSVALVGIREDQDGIYFFSHELLTQTRASLPGVSVEIVGVDRPESPRCLTYIWASGAIHRLH